MKVLSMKIGSKKILSIKVLQADAYPKNRNAGHPIPANDIASVRAR
jgi:hypothetical protein